MFGHPHMSGCPAYVWMPLVCFALNDVWMPCVHTQHKENMLCLTKGVSICPNTFGCPTCLDDPHMFGHPICLDAPCMFGYPHMFGHPICLDAPCMFRYTPYVWTPPYVWMPPLCLDDVWMPTVHIQHKESMLC